MIPLSCHIGNLSTSHDREDILGQENNAQPQSTIPQLDREAFLSPVCLKSRQWFVEPQTELVYNMSSFLKKTAPVKSSLAGFHDYTPESSKKYRAEISSFTKGKKSESSSGKMPVDQPHEPEGVAVDELFLSSRQKIKSTLSFTPPKEMVDQEHLEVTGLQRRLVFDSHPSPPPLHPILRCTICAVSVLCYRVELSCCPNTFLCKRCFDKFYLKERAKDARCPYCKTKDALKAVPILSDLDFENPRNHQAQESDEANGGHIPFTEDGDITISY